LEQHFRCTRNTISNINFSTTIGTTTAAGIFSGISVLAGTIGSTTGNTIGSTTGNDAIRFHLPLP
jgi:hypothetical protein